jgi:hypothetical protein
MSDFQPSDSNAAPGVAQVTMSRPAVFNAFDEAMIGELDAAFAQLEADPAVRVIVLAGEGRHFSAGADLQWMQRASQATREWNLARTLGASPACCARIEALLQAGGGARAGRRPRRRRGPGLRLRRGGGRRGCELLGQRGEVRHPAGRHRPLRDQRGGQAPGPAPGAHHRAHRRGRGAAHRARAPGGRA